MPDDASESHCMVEVQPGRRGRRHPIAQADARLVVGPAAEADTHLLRGGLVGRWCRGGCMVPWPGGLPACWRPTSVRPGRPSTGSIAAAGRCRCWRKPGSAATRAGCAGGWVGRAAGPVGTRGFASNAAAGPRRPSSTSRRLPGRRSRSVTHPAKSTLPRKGAAASTHSARTIIATGISSGTIRRQKLRSLPEKHSCGIDRIASRGRAHRPPRAARCAVHGPRILESPSCPESVQVWCSSRY
jgi:hypothetical protein